MRRRVLLLLLAVAAFSMGVGMLKRHGPGGEPRALTPRATESADTAARRLAVLGDSDSHSYRDYLTGLRRGGEHHASTYQWTEILALTRAEYIDQGEHAAWGTRRVIAIARSILGLEAKTPRKQDFRWNYARSGARCASLGPQWPHQTRWLVSALRAEPEAWADGVVVIRIGVNDLGQRRHLESYRNSGLTDAVRDSVTQCVRGIEEAVRAVREASESVGILLVGIADDSSWPYGRVPHMSTEEVARIRTVLDHYDAELRRIADTTRNAAFMDDRAWYYRNWADRDEQGNAVLAERSLGGMTPVTNTQGDEPNHLVLADGHAGTVANGFWARQLIETLDREFGWNVPILEDREIARLADPEGAFGISPPSGERQDPSGRSSVAPAGAHE